jgi:hypothetical protein
MRRNHSKRPEEALATLAIAVIFLFVGVGLPPAHAQKKQRVSTGDDPYGLKVAGMPKANHKYLITDLPSGTKVPAEYSPCGNGVYYYTEKVRGIHVTVVLVHFRAEGDFDLSTGPLDLSKLQISPDFEDYVPPGWVSLTFTLLRDSFTLQEIRLIRTFPKRPEPGTNLQRVSGLTGTVGVRVYRSWVDKDPYVAWEILPESQLSHLVFRIRLPKFTKACLESKK